jgi:hypothetical protein
MDAETRAAVLDSARYWHNFFAEQTTYFGDLLVSESERKQTQVRKQHLRFFTKPWVVRALLCLFFAREFDQVDFDLDSIIVQQCNLKPYDVKREKTSVLKQYENVQQMINERCYVAEQEEQETEEEPEQSQDSEEEHNVKDEPLIPNRVAVAVRFSHSAQKQSSASMSGPTIAGKKRPNPSLAGASSEFTMDFDFDPKTLRPKKQRQS